MSTIFIKEEDCGVNDPKIYCESYRFIHYQFEKGFSSLGGFGLTWDDNIIVERKSHA